jgi:ubiquinone/menaquinone biosynthesis C-methylase UbiE
MKLRILLLVLCLTSCVVAEPTAAPPTHYMGREIATTMHWSGASWLIRKTREREESADLMLSKLGVKEGMAVCDLGCGNGYHALKLAKMVGEEGVVFGVDIQPEMLDLLAQRAHKVGVKNVKPIVCTEDDTKLPAASCDIVLMVDVYHEVSRPQEVLASIRCSLKPGGKLVLVEFRSEDPDVPIKPLHKMSKAQIEKELTANGYKHAESFDDLPWQHMETYVVEEAKE